MFHLSVSLLAGKGMGVDCDGVRPDVCRSRDCYPFESRRLCANRGYDPAPGLFHSPCLYFYHVFYLCPGCSLGVVFCRSRGPCYEVCSLRAAAACLRVLSCLYLLSPSSQGAVLFDGESLDGRPSSRGRPHEVFCANQYRWVPPTHA